MDIHWKQKHTGDMQVRQNNGITYLSYPRLEQESAIVHGFSTRLGGVSEGYLGSMNLSFSRGDNPENVLENYRRISKAIGFPVESIATSDQTHTTNVRRVGKEDCGCGVLRPLIFLRSNPQSHRSVPFRLAGNCRKHRKSNRRSHARSLPDCPGRPHRSHRPLYLPGVLRSKQRRHRGIPSSLPGTPPPKPLLPETKRKIPAKPLGSLPPEPPHQRHPRRKHPYPQPLHLLQPRFPLFPPRLPRQTRKPRSLPGTTIKKEPYTYKNTVYVQITIIIMVI